MKHGLYKIITFKIVFQCLQIEEQQMINLVALLFTFPWSSFTVLFVTVTPVAELQWEHNSVEAYGLRKTKLYLTVMLCLLDMRVLISAQMLDPILHATFRIFLHEIGKIYACVYKPGGEPKGRLLQQYFLNLQPFPLSWSSEKNMIFYVHKCKINLRTFASVEEW